MAEIRQRFRSNLIHGIKYAESKPKEPEYISNFLPVIHKRVIQLKSQNPDLTLEELKQIMEQDILDFSKAVFVGCNAPDAYVEYACSLYLEKHPDILNQLLNRIETENLQPKDEVFYSSHNFQEDLIEYLLVLQKDFPNVLENLKQAFEGTDLLQIIDSPTLSQAEKYKKANEYIRKNIIPQYRKECMLATSSHIFGIRSYIAEDRQTQEVHLRENLIEYITSMIEQLKKFGFLDGYNRSNTKQTERLGLSNLAYSQAELDKLLNPNLLASLPVDELLALSVFWLNRYTKEFDTYANAMFAVKEFDLLPKMLASDNPYSIRISKEYLSNMFVKMHTLYYPCIQYFEEQQVECNQIDGADLSDEEAKGNYIIFSYDPLVKRLQEDFGEEYTEYFCQGPYPGKHDLAEDVLCYAKMQSPIYAAKTTKDDFLTAMLISLQNNPNLVNGGVILEPDQYPEDILDQRFVGLAMDYNLTAPVRLHIRLDSVRDFLLGFQNHAKIQVYEGNEDFRVPENQIMKNHLILPFDKKNQKALKTYAQRELGDMPPRIQRCVQHLNFLRDSKQVPDHLKTPVINAKGKQEKVFRKRYIDLLDGQIYVLKDNEYVLDESISMEGDDLENERE